MRRFQYIEPLHNYRKGHSSEGVTITVTAYWITVMYYPHWCEMMEKVGQAHRIDLEECIQDFCVINWAVEL